MANAELQPTLHDLNLVMKSGSEIIEFMTKSTSSIGRLVLEKSIFDIGKTKNVVETNEAIKFNERTGNVSSSLFDE